MSKLSQSEVETFVNDVAALIRSGMPVPDGLRELSAQFNRPRLRELSEHVAAATAKGQSLTDALSSSPVKVPKGMLALFECAQVSGDSRALLSFTAVHTRRIRAYRSALSTAAFYPMMVLVGFLMLVGFIAIWIIPKFVDIFSQLGAELPWLTQQIVILANLIGHNPVGLGILALLIVGIPIFACSEATRDRLFEILSVVPGYSSLIALSDTAITMKYLGVMLSKGVPLPKALQSVSMSVSLASTRQSLEKMAAAAEKGQRVAPLLNPMFPATAVHLFEQAENSGRLAEACEGIGDWADTAFEQQGRRAAGVLEPTALLLILLGIGIMVIALYLPLFSIPKLVGR
ncbi:hypothetical protein GC173_05420 [bacterium]|nr:hypothetical protein [bacterium]